MDRSVEGKPRTRKNQQEIQEILDEFDKAGCTVNEFCLSKGITLPTFHKLQSRYSDKPVKKKRSSGFTELQI